MSFWKKLKKAAGQVDKGAEVASLFGVPGASIIEKVAESIADPQDPNNLAALNALAQRTHQLETELAVLKRRR